MAEVRLPLLESMFILNGSSLKWFKSDGSILSIAPTIAERCQMLCIHRLKGSIEQCSMP